MIKYFIFGLTSLLAFGSCDATASNDPSGEEAATGISSTFGGQLGNFFYDAPGADQVGSTRAPEGGSDYLFIAGSSFTPRTDTQTLSYPGAGCSFSNGFLISNLDLPSGTTVNGVRLYYFSNTSGDTVRFNLGFFDGGGGTGFPITGVSTLSSGYSSQYFTPTTPPLIIDTLTNSYALLASMDAGTRFCGMRVFYTN